MLDPKTIVLSLLIIAGEPLEDVSYFSGYLRIQEGPVNLSLFLTFPGSWNPFPNFLPYLHIAVVFFFFDSLTLLFHSVKQGCPCLPCLEYWGAPLKDMSHGALVLS